MGSYSIHWSLDLLSDTITLNVANRPVLGTKVISKENPRASFYVANSLDAKFSGDFNLKQLSLSGSVRLPPHHFHPGTLRKYENVIVVSW
jgi:hypothetical protein